MRNFFYECHLNYPCDKEIVELKVFSKNFYTPHAMQLDTCSRNYIFSTVHITMHISASEKSFSGSFVQKSA